MARQRRAHRYIGGFLIANLPYDQHLRILPHQVSGRPGKGEAARLVYLSLHDAGQHLLHRVLHGYNVSPTLLGQVAKTGINGGRLAAAGRTR